MRITLYVLVIMAAAALMYTIRVAVASYRGGRSDYRRWPAAEISRRPERTGIPGLQEVAFADPGESRLAGWYAPSRNGAAVVLVHGTSADRSSLLTETRFLATSGFGALAIDIPGQGSSEGVTGWGLAERKAISAAVTWLGTRAEVDPQRIGAFGYSMGAYVVVQAAVLDTRLRSVVLLACPNDVMEQNWVTSDRWGLVSQLPNYWALRAAGQSVDMPPREVIGAIAPRPVLIINGDLDRAVPQYMAHQLFAAAGDPKELWIVTGAHHNDVAKVAPHEYPERLTGFFRRTLSVA